MSTARISALLACLASAACHAEPEAKAASSGGGAFTLFVEDVKLECDSFQDSNLAEAEASLRVEEVPTALGNGLAEQGYSIATARDVAGAIVSTALRIDVCRGSGEISGYIQVSFVREGERAVIQREVAGEVGDLPRWTRAWVSEQVALDSRLTAFLTRLQHTGSASDDSAALAKRAAEPAAAATTAPAASGGPDQRRERAKELAASGVEHVQGARFAEGLEALNQAYRLMPVPTINLWRARALAGTGKLVEARAELLRIFAVKLAPDSPEPFRQARTDAQRELLALDEKIPTLLLELEGVSDENVLVRIDGVTVPDEQLLLGLFGVGLPLNPGEHTVYVEKGERKVTRTITLVDGRRTERLVLRLGAR